MYLVLFVLLFAGCATAASGDDVTDTGGPPPGRELGAGGGDDLSRGGDLGQTPGADLAASPDLSAQDLGPAPAYAYPRVNEVVPGAAGVAVDEYVEIIGADHDIALKGW